MTKYFVENFEYYKKIFSDELKRKNKEIFDETEIDVEWENKNRQIKLGYWINTSDKFHEAITTFKLLNIEMTDFPKVLVQTNTILRFFYSRNDNRELQKKEYSPYISISGVYYIDQILYPNKSQINRNWEIRELVGNKYKSGIDGSGFPPIPQNFRIRFKIQLGNEVYIKGLEGLVLVGKYSEETGKWVFGEVFDVDPIVVEKGKNIVGFYTNDLGTMSVLLERKIFFPYKSWYLRCVNDSTAILDLSTPRLDFVFKIGIKESANKKIMGYVKLIENNDPEFSHIADKELTYEELVMEMRYCGILLNPLDEDILAVGRKIKNNETQDRAINDIVMAVRKYAIRSHSENYATSSDIIIAKFKPNLEYDYKFFDDEEKDWFEVAWKPNKCILGRTYKEDEDVKFEVTSETVNFI